MILKNLIYIYQLEYYDKKRFLSFVYKNLRWMSFAQRSKLEWTIRSILIFSLTVICIILSMVMMYYFIGLIGVFLLLFLYLIFLPYIIIFSDILISPFVLFQKSKIINRAKNILREHEKRGLMSIGITGSFGKTSMKNILVSVLSEKYKIFTFPGNINTDIGIAQYVIQHIQDLNKVDILISEMGAYKKGDIKKLCSIINPYYSIITSIGECHLDRFGSLQNIISAKFELANATRKKVFLNICDKNITKYADLNIAKNITTVKICGNKEVSNIKYLENFNGISFTYHAESFVTKIIADYVIDFSIIAFTIGRELGLDVLEMENGLQKASSVSHRLECIKNKELNRVIIDDSYNGNYEGFLLGLKILSRAKGRKVALTPGIVELNKERSQEVHESLAEKYARNVDLVLLMNNKNTIFIINRFKELGYNTFKIYETAMQAHNDLVNVLKNGDTIIFQNDVSDNYS